MIRKYIEKELSIIDEDTFQSLMDHFIAYDKNIEFKGSPGSVVAKVGTSKGTPDSYFLDKNKKYIFAEYTTQKSNIVNKLKKDINHCFEIEELVPKISEIILACTKKLKPEEFEELNQYLKNINSEIDLTIYSIQELAMKLSHFPDLNSYLPINSFEGISTLNGFINLNKGFRPNLKNPFVKNEIFDQLLDLIKNNDILLISGDQGIGKSRMAVEIARSFMENYDYKPFFVKYHSMNLTSDFLKLLDKKGNYLVVIDNYDDSFKNIDRFIQFLDNYDANIKIIITFKNQYINVINKNLNDFVFSSFNLSKISYLDLNKIIDNYLKRNKLYLKNFAKKKIINMSKGNPNLVLMTLYPAIEQDNEKFLDNPIKVYDKYFEDYKKINNISFEKEDIKILGILSFFKVFDKTDDLLNKKIEECFEINLIENWHIFEKLKKFEFVDIFNDSLVKPSDDVLKNYAFYLTFLKKNSLDFGLLLDKFIDSHYYNFKEVIYDLHNVFNFSEFKNILYPLINPFKLKYSDDYSKMLKFYKLFYYFYERDSLIFVKQWVESLEIEKYDFNEFEIPPYNGFISEISEISLLSNFYKSTIFLEESLNITLEFLLKKPSKFNLIIKEIVNNFSFTFDDFENKFQLKNKFIDFLVEKENNYNKVILKNNIFLEILSKLFLWRFSVDEYIDGAVLIRNGELYDCDSLRNLRSKLLLNLFDISNFDIIKFSQVFETYINQLNESNIEIYINEESLIYDFFKKCDNSYIFSKLIYKYIKESEKLGVNLVNNFDELYDSEKIKIAKIYTSDFDYFEPKVVISNINADLKDKNKIEIINILNVLDEIYNSDKHITSNIYLDNFFECIANKDIDIFCECFKIYITDFYFNSSTHFISTIIEKELLHIEKFYNLISMGDYKEKNWFKFSFFKYLKVNDCNEFLFNEFLDFLNETEIFYLMPEYFMKFNNIYMHNLKTLNSNGLNNIVQYISNILLNKLECSGIILLHDFFKNNLVYFQDNINLLKKLYIKYFEKDKSFDYDYSNLKAIASVDYTIIKDFLLFINNNYNYYDEDINLSFLWDLDVSEEFIDEIFGILYDKKYMITLFLTILFEGSENEIPYIKLFIKKNLNSKRRIKIIFEIILEKFTKEKFISFIKYFLENNYNIEFFKKICFEKSYVIIGDSIKYHEDNISFFKDLINMIEKLPNTLKYSEHIDYLEYLIHHEKIRIIHEQERIFKKDF